VRWSRPVEGTSTTVTISREAGGWDVCCSGAEVPTQPLLPTGRQTSIDVGLKGFLVTAEGQSGAYPHHSRHSRHSRQAEQALQNAQQRVSRRTQGSSRRRTAVRVLTQRQQHVRQQHVRCLRQDSQHQTALTWVRTYDVIAVEGIQPASTPGRPSRYNPPVPHSA
jgi:putative transposase